MEEHQVRQAPVDVESIARDRGATVHKGVVQENVSGFLFRDTRTGSAIIGVNIDQQENRQRFTIAHELGHFLLHSSEGVHVDHTFVVKLRSELSSEGVNSEEIEANLFAAELLMPECLVKDDVLNLEDWDLTDEKEIKALASKYRVSVQAMTIRLTHLGLLPF